MKRLLLIIALMPLIARAQLPQTYFTITPPGTSAIPSVTFRGSGSGATRAIYGYWNGFYNRLIDSASLAAGYAKLTGGNSFSGLNSFTTGLRSSLAPDTATGVLRFVDIGLTTTGTGAATYVKVGVGPTAHYNLNIPTPDFSPYELLSNKVTTLDNSTTHYPSTSAVTTALGGYLPLSGGTMTGNINMGAHNIAIDGGINPFSVGSATFNEGAISFTGGYVDGNGASDIYYQGTNRVHITSSIHHSGSPYYMSFNLNDGNPYNKSYVELRSDVKPSNTNGIYRKRDIDSLFTALVPGGGGGGTVVNSFNGLTGTVVFDTTAVARKTGNSDIINKSYSITGASGNGFLDMLSQASSPSSVTNHLRLYSDSLNRLSWKNSTYRRTLRIARPSDYTASFPWRVNSVLADSTDVAVSLATKQPTGNYITALTGDATASGPGSAALTLATVNSNIGTFNNVTVNGKGLVTAASNISYQSAFTLSNGQIPYWSGSNLAGNNNLFWDSSNFRLGLNTNAPTHTLTLGSSSTGAAYYNTSDQTTNYERIRVGFNSNIFNIISEQGGTGVARQMQLNNSGTMFNIYNTSGSAPNALIEIRRDATSVSALFGVGSTGLSASSIIQSASLIYPTINQTSTGGYRMLWISPFESSTGSGIKYLIDAGTNTAADAKGTHTSKFTVDNTGITTQAGNAVRNGSTSGAITYAVPATITSYTQTDPNAAPSSNGMMKSYTTAGVSSWVKLPTTSHIIFTPSTGGSVTLTNNAINIINPSGTIAALTVTLPSSPADNSIVFIKFTQAVTTVTYSGGTIADSIISPAAGSLIMLTYDSSTATWY